jgi:hypothetical protein
MSKDKKRSLSQETIRWTSVQKVPDNLAKEVAKSDLRYSATYESRVDMIKTQIENYQRIKQPLKELKKYCGNKLNGFESKYNKKKDTIKWHEDLVKIKTLEQSELDKPVHFLKVYQHKKDGEEQLDFSLDRPLVRHYGIDAVGAYCLIGHIIEINKLHPVEDVLFQEAIRFLNDKCDAETFVNFQNKLAYANNVVLVDIFPRKNSNNINGNYYIGRDTKVKEEAETHTVVLWKVTESKVAVIDPTQKSYSDFLMGISGFDGFTFINKSPDKLYQPGTDEKKDPRDCTDIAAKIAFELNEKQKELNNVNEATDASIKQISNQQLDSSLKYFGLLQSSDYGVRKLSKAFIETNGKFLEYIDPKTIKTVENLETVNALLGKLKETSGKFLEYIDPKTIKTAEDLGTVNALLGDLKEIDGIDEFF